MCHGAPKASLKTHRMRRGGSRARRRALSPGLLLLSDRHVECWMHNNLLSHLRIHCPHPRTLFLASFLLSLRARGACSAPVGENISDRAATGIASGRERIGARAIAPDKRITTANTSSSNPSRFDGDRRSWSTEYALGTETNVMVHSRGMKCWPLQRGGQLDKVID